MGVSTWTEERLAKVARAGGLERRRNGLWSRNGGKAAWHMERWSQGWLTMRREFPLAEGQEPLAVHADWAGPVKLVRNDDRCEQRLDVFLGTSWSGEDDPSLDADAAGVLEDVTCGLLERFTSLDGQPCFPDWQPPAVDMFTAWLHAAGCETAVDKEQNLRVTLKRRGCDGQVRIEGSDGRIGFLLPLGRWKELDEVAAGAMKRLCRHVNDRSRLVRIAWRAADAETRCEAQVDLSGLPTTPMPHPQVDMIWREMTRLAIGGLELALRQLGLELAVVADATHRDLAEHVQDGPQGPGLPLEKTMIR